MRVIDLSIYPLKIPFVERFQHSLKDRAASDTVVVRVRTEDGVLGYGEGLPRPYVTGETVESLVEHVSNVLWPAIAEKEWSLEQLWDNLDNLLPQSDSQGTVRAHNAARCAVELALVDAITQTTSQGLHELLPPTINHVTYSGVITGGDAESAAKRAGQFTRLGLNHIKAKVGQNDSTDATVARIKSIREALGDGPVLRIDANAAWTVTEAIDALKALEPYNIASCEEPLAAQDWTGLAELRQQTNIPLMADESLVTFEDAKQLVSHSAIDLFNIRVSKCGGIGPCLKLAAYAKENGLSYQLGAHVGETAILSAAGRHLAAHWGDARFVEGSYGTLLLTEDLSRTSLRFGHKGKGVLLQGNGLGIQILQERIERYAEQTLEFRCS